MTTAAQSFAESPEQRSDQALDPAGKAYWRQVRRRVQAPVHRFVAIVAPELARICQQELVNAGITESTITEAGVEFSGKLATCYQANLWLRTASRILCRWPSFRTGVVGELFHKTAAIPWELWLNPLIPLKLNSHVQRSRMDHEGVVAETVLKALQQRFQQQGMPVPPLADVQEQGPGAEAGRWQQLLWVRLENNRCELSLDTTGPHLHRRGYRLQHAGAPLRETLAAAMVLKNAWRGDRPLVDGMCGAGTVAIEAALIARNSPPGINREFLFEQWPAYQPRTWDYLCRKAREGIRAPVTAPILALDSDPRALLIGQQNAARAFVADNIRWDAVDFFSFHPHSLGWKHGLLILDPPYGKRQPATEGLRTLYQRLGSHLRQSFKGWQVAVAAPSTQLALALGLKPARFWKIPHGGISVIISLAGL
jgi:putative N6-adenine-specific DNA methylase